MSCSCNLAGLIGTNYGGVFSASLNGSTQIELAEDGTVLLGATTNTLSIQAYPFSPGGDVFLGVSCASQVSVSIDWLQKYDCINDHVYFIPRVGGRVSQSGDSFSNVTILCDPNLVKTYWDANASSGPTTPVIITDRKDAYGLRYVGNPISIDSNNPQTYTFVLGSTTVHGYLTNFSLSCTPPSVATCSYSFVF